MESLNPPAAGGGLEAVRPVRKTAVRPAHSWRLDGTRVFVAGLVAFVLLMTALAVGVRAEYFLFAGYVVLQFIVLATGWNILGGYAGYVNFGAAGYFALGAYTGLALFKALGLPLPVLIACGAAVGALLGLATGAMSLRLRGVYFSIATLAITIVLETVVMNWEYVGGARGSPVARPAAPQPFASYQQYLFVTMTFLVVIAVACARYVERSAIGRGLAAIRDDEIAAECSGVPTLRLKLAAAALSGAIMSSAGAPFAMYLSFIEPHSAFSLNYALSAIAMPIIGGMAHWAGPVAGALLLATVQQVVAVSFSGAAIILITGLVLMVFVIAAPHGLVGLVRRFRRRAGE